MKFIKIKLYNFLAHYFWHKWDKSGCLNNAAYRSHNKWYNRWKEVYFDKKLSCPHQPLYDALAELYNIRASQTEMDVIMDACTEVMDNRRKYLLDDPKINTPIEGEINHIKSFQFSIEQQYFHYGNENDLPEDWIEIGRNIDRVKAHRFSKDFYDGKFSINSKEELLSQWKNYQNI